MTLNDFTQDIANYLCKKLPDVNVATLLEIAEFTTMRAYNYTQDEIKEASIKWCDQQKKANDLFLKYIEKRMQ